MRTALILFLSAVVCWAQPTQSRSFLGAAAWQAAQNNSGGGGGGGNNVAIVSGHIGGTITNSAAVLNYNMAGASMTSGNTVIVGVDVFVGGGYTITLGALTKSAGTSTIGTIVMDCSTNEIGAADAGGAIYRVPITGNGTLTLTYTLTGAGYMVLGAAEVSGLAASPLDISGVKTNAGPNFTTGSLTSATNGIIVYTTPEVAAADFFRKWSDTIIVNYTNASSEFSGFMQYKINNSSPNTLTSTNGADTGPGKVIYAGYKSS